MFKPTFLRIALTCPALLPLYGQAADTVSESAVGNDSGDTYGGGQVARDTQIGVLGNRALNDLPFSVASYTGKTITDQQARTVGDVQPKRAGNLPTRRVSLDYSSDARVGGHVDLGQRFGDDNRFGARINPERRHCDEDGN
ncbi:hypothetical protein [Pseudomonas sp. G(2018)]|uniref:hypothetical protein n=1 Tax=Pseudomonas sp. G(2018) TaxID=2502242 RepID=UPI0010F5C6BC|nr:hypothetical protein [Pseudomonas sp. G(2018)]